MVATLIGFSSCARIVQRPLELGADIVMHSLTKYMNGHSDVIMGAAMVNSEDVHTRLRYLQNG